MAVSLVLWCFFMVAAGTSAVPVPTADQLDFMETELVQFMHFNVNTAW